MKPISESIIPNGHDGAAGSAEGRSENSAAINEANAQKSTRPCTEGGKQRSKLNALRHGLTGHAIALPSEDHAAYQRYSESFRDDCQSKGAIEIQRSLTAPGN